MYKRIRFFFCKKLAPTTMETGKSKIWSVDQQAQGPRELMCSSSLMVVGQRILCCWGAWSFCSVQAFNWLDRACPHWRATYLLKVGWLTVNLFQKYLPSWHIKLTITDSMHKYFSHGLSLIIPILYVFLNKCIWEAKSVEEPCGVSFFVQCGIIAIHSLRDKTVWIV